MDEELVNESDFLAKEWFDYKNDQTVMGKKPVLQDWLKAELKKYKKNDPFAEDYFGGKKKRNKKYARTNKRLKKYKKKNVKGTRKNKYTKNVMYRIS